MRRMYWYLICRCFKDLQVRKKITPVSNEHGILGYMDRRLLFAIPGLLILIVIAIAWWFVSHATHAPSMPAASTASSTPDLSGLAIYTNGEYGFSLVYPESAIIENSFKSYYHLPSTWRVNAEATGTPIVAVASYRIMNDHSYPRYFDTEVRVGVSSDPRELKQCLIASNGESAAPDTKIGNTTFKTVAFQQAGMMQYAKGVSYRTIYKGKCYAIEKIAAGSSYRDDPASSADIPDTMLDTNYANLDTIVQSFSFAGS